MAFLKTLENISQFPYHLLHEHLLHEKQEQEVSNIDNGNKKCLENESLYKIQMIRQDYYTRNSVKIKVYRVFISHSNVLRNISLLNNSKDFGDPDVTSYFNVGWVLKNEIQYCMVCSVRLSIYNRKEQCKACGNVVCEDCGRHRNFVKNLEWLGQLTICGFCNIDQKPVSYSPNHEWGSMVYPVLDTNESNTSNSPTSSNITTNRSHNYDLSMLTMPVFDQSSKNSPIQRLELNGEATSNHFSSLLSRVGSKLIPSPIKETKLHSPYPQTTISSILSSDKDHNLRSCFQDDTLEQTTIHDLQIELGRFQAEVTTLTDAHQQETNRWICQSEMMHEDMRSEIMVRWKEPMDQLIVKLNEKELILREAQLAYQVSNDQLKAYNRRIIELENQLQRYEMLFDYHNNNNLSSSHDPMLRNPSLHGMNISVTFPNGSDNTSRRSSFCTDTDNTTNDAGTSTGPNLNPLGVTSSRLSTPRNTGRSALNGFSSSNHTSSNSSKEMQHYKQKTIELENQLIEMREIFQLQQQEQSNTIQQLKEKEKTLLISYVRLQHHFDEKSRTAEELSETVLELNKALDVKIQEVCNANDMLRNLINQGHGDPSILEQNNNNQADVKPLWKLW